MSKPLRGPKPGSTYKKAEAKTSARALAVTCTAAQEKRFKGRAKKEGLSFSFWARSCMEDRCEKE